MKKFCILMFALLVSLHTHCTGSGNQEPRIETEVAPSITILSEEKAKTEKVEVRPLTLREILLERLKEAHQRGEFLDITEQDIMSLSMQQLETIFGEQEEIEIAKAKLEEIKLEAEEGTKIEIPPEQPKEQDLFQAAIDKIKEHKGLLGVASAMAVGSFAYLGLGQKLLKEETTEEELARMERMKHAKTWGKTEDSVSVLNYNFDPHLENATDEDYIKEITSIAISTPAESQYKQIIQLGCEAAPYILDQMQKDTIDHLKEISRRLAEGESFPLDEMQEYYEIAKRILLAKYDGTKCPELPPIDEIKKSEWHNYKEANKGIEEVLIKRHELQRRERR